MLSIQPLRLSMNKVCELLDITREGLRKLQMNDPTFPKPLKAGALGSVAFIMIMPLSLSGTRSKSSRLSCALIQYGG